MAIDKICDRLLCTGCGVCSQICPKKAIFMKENAEGFRYPEISAKDCVECGLCIKRCPISTAVPQNETAEVFMGWHHSKDVLMASSSGGAFTAIADYVLKKNGVIFGAAMDQETRVLRHQKAVNSEELNSLRASKYYQSQVADVYPEVKQLLSDGQWVLFSGTACQIAGLYAYLGECKRDQLITVDVLCHGVASKKVIDAYLESQEKRFRKSIASFSFRIKEGKRGWQRGGGTRMHMAFSDGSVHTEEGPYDSFFLGFNHNFFLRESCYRCKFCGMERVADFTLADFWGCKREDVPSEQMWLGVSLVLINSPKAKAILPDLQQDMVLIPIDPQEAVPFNRALTAPQDRPEIRERFYSSMEKIGYLKTIERAFPKRFLKFRIKNILKKILPRVVAAKIMKNI